MNGNGGFLFDCRRLFHDVLGFAFGLGSSRESPSVKAFLGHGRAYPAELNDSRREGRSCAAHTHVT